ncbi:MAG: bifunctional alpha,alpha-trehalose-phosphate synthase (UDP-forming)/trehalose-phosphatase [Candidatus Binatia bacterium]
MERGYSQAERAARRGDATAEQPIVVVSNRLPVTVHRGPRGLEGRRSAGGLVSALEPVLEARGGTWIGWPGIELRAGETFAIPDGTYDIRALPLTEGEVTGYYHGFSNRTLWPLLHSFPGRTRFDRREWEVYKRVNMRFAESAAAVGAGASLVWIHDYHLMLAPLYLRELLRSARIAFFLHIPFPPYDLFRLLPWDRELLSGLLGCDLIGFHVEAYARNFLDCVERLLGARVDRGKFLLEHGDRTVRVGAFPLGIDFDLFEARARAAPAALRAERLVLGVDRLDYTKGMPERLLAFERLLERHPEHRERVVLLQLAVPSRFQVSEYRELKRQVDELVGRINGRFATAHWSPIRYLYRAVSPERLAALYRDADVALVTPLRDGMNVVAKEYVACQVADPGVLVLSRLAGVAETMREAIQVNPYNVDGTAEAIHRALTMDEAERRSRLVALRRRERRYNVYWWVKDFLSAAFGGQVGLHPPADSDFEAWLGPFLRRHRLVLFLDYDGTLTPLRDHPAKAVLSKPMRRALDACARRSDTDVVIISGRSLDDIRQMVNHPHLTYAGNHGLEIAGPDFPPFCHEDLRHYEAKTAELAAKLAEMAPRGAWTEEKGATLTFHYRGVEAAKQARVAEQARDLITKAGFQARGAHCALEAHPPIGWDKGQAVLHIGRMRYGAAWSESVRVVYVGDDQADEDAFRVLAGLAITFRVGSADTQTGAARRLPNVEAVRALLEWLARRPAVLPEVSSSRTAELR